MARIFILPVLIYVLILIGVLCLSLSSATPWTDPRFGRVAKRMFFYPAILLSLVFAGFALISRFIDQGYTWSIYVIVPAFLVMAWLILKLAGVMVGDVRKQLNQPILIQKET